MKGLKEIGKVARFVRAPEKEINAIGIVPRVPYTRKPRDVGHPPTRQNSYLRHTARLSTKPSGAL